MPVLETGIEQLIQTVQSCLCKFTCKCSACCENYV